MGSRSFVHLHVHTEYSMLDGAARLKQLFAETDRLGMKAIAMTDHGNMYGAYDFYKQATAAGIKPIMGVESYVTPNTSRFDRTRVRWAEGGETTSPAAAPTPTPAGRSGTPQVRPRTA